MSEELEVVEGAGAGNTNSPVSPEKTIEGGVRTGGDPGVQPGADAEAGDVRDGGLRRGRERDAEQGGDGADRSMRHGSISSVETGGRCGFPDATRSRDSTTVSRAGSGNMAERRGSMAADSVPP